MKKLISLIFLTVFSVFSSSNTFSQTENNLMSNCINSTELATTYDFNHTIFNTNSSLSTLVLTTASYPDVNNETNRVDNNEPRTINYYHNNSDYFNCRFDEPIIVNTGFNNIFDETTKQTIAKATSLKKIERSKVKVHLYTSQVFIS